MQICSYMVYLDIYCILKTAVLDLEIQYELENAFLTVGVE